MGKRKFMSAALCLALAAGLSLPAEASVTERQNDIYRSFRAHLHMGKAFDAAKLYVAGEYGIGPEEAASEYFAVKLYRMNETWGNEIKNRIREALSLRALSSRDLGDFTVDENYASFSYTEAEPVPDASGVIHTTPDFTPRETAYRIADAVFADVPEIDLLRIVIRSPGHEGEPRAEKFDFMKQM